MRLIDADSVVKELMETRQRYSQDVDVVGKTLCATLLYAANVINHAQTEERPKSEWVVHKNVEGYVDEYECSACHKKWTMVSKTKYCPNCGAVMSNGEK